MKTALRESQISHLIKEVKAWLVQFFSERVCLPGFRKMDTDDEPPVKYIPVFGDIGQSITISDVQGKPFLFNRKHITSPDLDAGIQSFKTIA
jgi:hypothetical protein